MRMIFLYGPPGSGKSSLGNLLAVQLNLPFIDLDREIVERSGMAIAQIFQQQGEAGFRRIEKSALLRVLEGKRQVVALGGGTLLDAENRARVEANGSVVCLSAPFDQLHQRLEKDPDLRPLLAGAASNRLRDLLAERSAHYASFQMQVDTSSGSMEEITWQIQIRLGEFYVHGMQAGYGVLVQPGGLSTLGERLEALGLHGKMAVVSDTHVSAIYGEQVCAALRERGFTPALVQIQAGEKHKNLSTVSALWERFIDLGMERGSSVIALGGGVTGDLAGFAAATFLRGVAWINLPTSLLAMVDASLGGKTGFDLPQGKNLVGAFHSPRLVLSDPQTLDSLPAVELRSGMAEVLKAGIVGDPGLFHLCAQGLEKITAHMQEIICRGVAVKVKLVQADPYEKGGRAALNLGHTIGHALELVSGYQLSHGEAVAIGMYQEARLAEALGVAGKDLAQGILAALKILDLPVNIPAGIAPQDLLEGMRVDKKKKAGALRFALPEEIGKVQVGVQVSGRDLDLLMEILESGR